MEHLTIPQRLENYSQRVPAPYEGMDDCWVWQGAPNRKWGYGSLRIAGRRRLVHRVSYEEYNGPIPPGMVICHRCDRRMCINPNHLFAGTVKDNIDDMVAKGRAVWQGGAPETRARVPRRAIPNGWHWRKLSEEQARYVLACEKPSGLIAKEFGVDIRTIDRIRRGETYKDVLVK